MKKFLGKILAVSVMSCGLASFAAEPQAPGPEAAPIPPPAPALKCPKCGCEMPAPKMERRSGTPGMDRQMPGGPGNQMNGRRGGMMRRGMPRLPFEMKDLSEEELAKFLTLGKAVRTATMAYQKEQNDANRASLEKAVKELTVFTQAQKVKSLEKKLAAAKAEADKIDELAKQYTERLLKRAAEMAARRNQKRPGRGMRPGEGGDRPEGAPPAER